MRNQFDSIGVMQGRLLPKYLGQYQAHPFGYWEDEFEIAKNLGVDYIEFILDYDNAYSNPLLNLEGINKISDLIQKTGVDVKTVCADYFMKAPLHSPNKNISKYSIEIMCKLVSMCRKLDISVIVLPCVDQSSLNSKEDKDRLVSAINAIISNFENANIFLSLETDLAPEPFAELLQRFNSEKVTVNYDIGNSASLGFDPIEELNTYGKLVSDVHIKDRVLGGGPVILGEGDANFDICIDKLREIGYQGPYVMQAYRDEEGVNIFKNQLDWFLKKREKINAR